MAEKKVVSSGFMEVEARAAFFVKIVTLKYNARNARRFIRALRYGNKEALRAILLAPLGGLGGPIGAGVAAVISAAIVIGVDTRETWADRIQSALRRTPRRGVIVQLGFSPGFLRSPVDLRAKPRR